MRAFLPALALLWLLGLAAPSAADPTPPGADEASAPVFDHHMHIMSPKAAGVLKTMCKKVGPEKCPPEISTEPSTAADALKALDDAGMRGGALLSTGYFFASPDSAELHLDVSALTRAENAFVVSEASKSCGRLLAFVSVNPLAPNALSELRYWVGRPGVAGIKLHLENSDLSYRDPRQVARLAAAFRIAGRARLPLVVHMESRADDYGAQDVAILLKQVLPKARGAPVQIAHAAGGGGVNEHTLSALGAFADAIEADPKGTANIFFDLAMVPDLVANTASLHASKPNVEKLKALMSRIGMSRFVLASDYTMGLNLKNYYSVQRTALSLTDEAWRALASNLAPYATLPSGQCRTADARPHMAEGSAGAAAAARRGRPPPENCA
jgi:predicted TIM-barrel fold metal-dependent hydrolase